MKEHQVKVMDWLREQGAENITLDKGGSKRHGKINFNWKGKPDYLLVSRGKASNNRSTQNLLAQIKRKLREVS